jgi:hypothetical protein
MAAIVLVELGAVEIVPSHSFSAESGPLGLPPDADLGFTLPDAVLMSIRGRIRKPRSGEAVNGRVPDIVDVLSSALTNATCSVVVLES